MATKERLKAMGISKSYDRFEALRDLSFEVGAGEVLGLLGPNGAGKTTAIRVLTTIFPPSRGSFTLDGIPHTRASEIRARIGVLPESTGYPLNLTGEDYLTFFGRLFGKSHEDARKAAVGLLSTVGLAERGASRIATYSRGMRQRLGMARALVNDPEVLFLDEPTLGFDPRGQREVLDIINGIARQRGTSVVLSTHFLEAVEQVCTRVIILNRGRVVADGSVDEVKHHVRLPRVGRFQVPPGLHDKALATLEGLSVVSEVSPEGTGAFLVTVREGDAGTRDDADPAMSAVLAALLAGHVPVRSFSIESASLGDAFLQITEEAGP